MGKTGQSLAAAAGSGPLLLLLLVPAAFLLLFFYFPLGSVLVGGVTDRSGRFSLGFFF